MSIDYEKLNDQIVKQAWDHTSVFLNDAQKQRLFQNKIDRAAAMIRAQEQFRRMEQEQWYRRGLEKRYLGSLISSRSAVRFRHPQPIMIWDGKWQKQ